MNNIQELIKQISGVDIFQQTRKQEVIEYRAVANLFLNKVMGKSLMDIVRWYQSNGKSCHHATIIFSIKNYEIYSRYNKNLSKMFNTLVTTVTSTVSLSDLMSIAKNLSENDLKETIEYAATKINENSYI